MSQLLRTFFNDEKGAVTVDWIVITAAVVGMSAIGFYLLEDASLELMQTAGEAVAAEAVR